MVKRKQSTSSSKGKSSKKSKKEQAIESRKEALERLLRDIDSTDIVDIAALISGSYAAYHRITVGPILFKALFRENDLDLANIQIYLDKIVQHGVKHIAFAPLGLPLGILAETMLQQLEDHFKAVGKLLYGEDEEGGSWDYTKDYEEWRTLAIQAEADGRKDDARLFWHLYHKYKAVDDKIKLDAQKLLIAIAVFATCLTINITKEWSTSEIVGALVEALPL
jgi:hypothetical protein